MEENPLVLNEEVKAVTTSAKPALSLLLKLMQPLQPPTQSWKPFELNYLYYFKLKYLLC
jgi:hypothetical protein